MGAFKRLVIASSADSHHSLASPLSASQRSECFARSTVQIPQICMMRSGLLDSRPTNSTFFQAVLSSAVKAALKRVAALLSAGEEPSAAARPSAHMHRLAEILQEQPPSEACHVMAPGLSYRMCCLDLCSDKPPAQDRILPTLITTRQT